MPPKVSSDISSIPILATAVVPWTDTFQFDEPAFRHQVQMIAEGLTRHIYLFGTAGEGYAVTDKQFVQIVRCFRACADEFGVNPMLGVISLSLPTIIERIELSRNLGFSAFQISLPAWGALNDKELERFFAETCGRFPDCRFLHYNLGRTKRILTPAEYGRFSKAHPNLVAVKMGVQDPVLIRELFTCAPRLRFFFTEFGYAMGRKIGSCGLLISLAVINYQRAHEYVTGDDRLRDAYVADLKVVAATLAEISKDRCHMDGAFDKLLHKVNAPDFPLRLLPPYESTTEDDYPRFVAALPASWRANRGA
jgi:dihydrodipicolinate synthase/N-acetylneuraminate lyase